MTTSTETQDKITVITNGHWHELRMLCELPEGVAAREFDYVTPEDDCSPRFFLYRGAWYDANEFLRVSDGLANELPARFASWHGVQTNSYFSATLIRFDVERDHEFVQVARASW